ncbi:MAG: VWA domain-containing protein [Calditrichaeota bacterium]|nr:VWA domain-containing protein [Calditrichota bacterium]
MKPISARKSLVFGTTAVLCLLSIFLINPFLSEVQAQCFTTVDEPAVNYIVLVIDKSGSMGGQAMTDAKIGAKTFISEMASQDYAMVVEFNDRVRVTQGFTNDRDRLHSAIDGLDVSGGTALYDAMAKSISILSRQSSSKIIVFLTDGRDGSSLYTAQNINSMSVSEGIFVYGIGLGDVDTQVLHDMTNSTNGNCEITKRSSELADIYSRVLSGYYKRFGRKKTDSGGITVKSIPSGETVKLDGQNMGRTPVKLDNIDPGEHQVAVEFNRGVGRCKIPVEIGKRTIVDLRESDLGRDVVITSSSPANASVFMDGEYVGICESHGPITMGDNWKNEALAWPQLTIKNVPLGTHTILLRGIPDFDYGSDQEMTIELKLNNMDDDTVIIHARIIQKIIQSNARICRNVSKGGDPFGEMEGW